MSALQIFQFNEQDLIVHQDIAGELWFRGTNVCKILGYSNSAETLRIHVNDYLQELAIGEGKPALYLAEAGLYILCFRAKTQQALEFQIWAANIIKEIRKTGRYVASESDRQKFELIGMPSYLNEAVGSLVGALKNGSVEEIRAKTEAVSALHRLQKADAKNQQDDAKQRQVKEQSKSFDEYVEHYIKIALDEFGAAPDPKNLNLVRRLYRTAPLRRTRAKFGRSTTSEVVRKVLERIAGCVPVAE